MEIEDYIVATDLQLVGLASEGDQQAFEHLFTRYSEAIRRLFEQRLGDKSTASDLLQETFIKVYLHHLRRRSDDIPIDERFRSPAASSPNPEESVIINQSHTHFEASLNELTEDYRRIIEMRFLDEYSYEEIAEKLGRPLNTVKTQIRRAKAAVCKMILEKEAK